MSRFARRLQQSTKASSGSGSSLNAPSHVTASPGDGKVLLSWVDSEGAMGYDVEYRVNPSGTWSNWPHIGQLTSETITGLTNGTAYDFRVRATEGASDSPWSTLVVGIVPEAPAFTGTGVPAQLTTVFVNSSRTNTVYAYVIGLDPNDGKWMLVTSDGQGTYKPPTPGVDHTPLAVDCAIPLNAIGAAGKQIVIPHVDSGRIFFSYDQKMHFFMNSNGGFVMPSQTNTSDPNIDIQWTFCEFSLNNVEIYGNISYVDMLSIPVAFKLEVGDGTDTQYVEGLPDNTMETVASQLLAQKTIDGTDWDKCLYYNTSSELVRIVSPNSATQIYPTAFAGYLEPYIDAVWAKYAAEPLTVNTGRGDWGVDVGQISGGILDFGGGMTFAKPDTASIWSCSIPPWTTGNDEQGNLTARITAAFNRTTLLLNSNQPDGENPDTYYQHATTNHYSRIVHSLSYGRLGYAFPYDDVHPEGGISYEGRIQSGSPRRWTVTVGQV